VKARSETVAVDQVADTVEDAGERVDEPTAVRAIVLDAEREPRVAVRDVYPQEIEPAADRPGDDGRNGSGFADCRCRSGSLRPRPESS
jgi:hypothetical protein